MMIVDVRTSAEYRKAHLPGSINLPLDEIRNIITIASDKNMPVYLYCQTGRQSGCARTVLLYLGYTKVLDLGSMEEASASLGIS